MRHNILPFRPHSAIDTRPLPAEEWRSTIPPAEASTDLLADKDGGSPGEGGFIAVLWLAMAVFAIVGAVAVLARLA